MWLESNKPNIQQFPYLTPSSPYRQPLKIIPITQAEFARSGVSEVYVKPPTTVDELFVVLHELGHHECFKAADEIELACLLNDTFICATYGIASYKMWDHELGAWLYAFGCVNPKYHGKLYNTAYWALLSYFDRLADPPPVPLKEIFLRALRYGGINVTSFENTPLTEPYWWPTYLKLNEATNELRTKIRYTWRDYLSKI